MAIASSQGVDSGAVNGEDSPLAPGVTNVSYFRWKRPVDLVLTILLLLPALPIIAFLIVLVRLTSSGPGLFRQCRVGRNGRRFDLYKIRTMVQDAEAATGAVWTERQDPRITRVGRVLRRLHLDELPQLLNVLRGDMSLVGPRPERPEFVAVLSEAIPGYLQRLAVEPGITGLAQINLPPDTGLESVRRKLALDLEYVRKAGFLLDLRMLGCTALRVFGIPGDWAMSLFRLRWNGALREPQVHISPVGAKGTESVRSHPLTPKSVVAKVNDHRSPEGPLMTEDQPHRYGAAKSRRVKPR